MKKEQIHSWKIISGAMVLGFLCILILLFLPFASQVYEKYSVLTSQNDRIALMGNWQEQLVDIHSKQVVIDEGIAEMMVDITSEDELSRVIERFYDVSRASVTTISRIQPLDARRENGYLIRSVEIGLSGSYHSTARFVNLIERSGMLIELQSMYIESSEENTLLGASIQLEVTLAGVER